MIGFILAAALAAAPPTGGCNEPLVCRHVTEFDLVDGDGQPLTVKVNADFDYVINNRLMLLPGEMVTIGLTEREGQPPLVSVLEVARADSIPFPHIGEKMMQEGGELPPDVQTALKERQAPTKGVRLSFMQIKDGGMLLVVENATGRRLDYHAQMTLTDGRREPTSLCDLLPGLPSYENWPHPIVGLELDGFQFIEGEPDEMVCD